MRYIGESQLAKDLVTKDYVDNKVANLASKDDIVHKSDLTAYATKDELKGIELTPGPAGKDAVLNVQVVPFAPSYQEPGTIYLVRGV
ncbi:phage protein [Streptococcus dysgalactiae subsp. equisimilis]|uniref:hypothetical protein n=1 Tax=Streptococcus dysgalactiae TaxID=1334 RepID=UPI0010F3404D|nr:hypothetical protein [Streptococcus dysgalactiae]VTT19366.1 phage protein [Streptococcus dysgalactiae subsp. equisimilis]